MRPRMNDRPARQAAPFARGQAGERHLVYARVTSRTRGTPRLRAGQMPLGRSTRTAALDSAV